MASWRFFRTFREDDLYAILGGSSSFEKPLRRTDSLGLRTTYDVTTRTIKKGKERFKNLFEKIKKEICTQWRQFKQEHGIKIKQAEIIAMLYVAASQTMEPSSNYEILALTELVFRMCDNSLDVLCEDSDE